MQISDSAAQPLVTDGKLKLIYMFHTQINRAVLIQYALS